MSYLYVPLLVLGLFLVGANAYVRLAPLDVATLHHQPPAKPIGDHLAKGGFHAVRGGADSETLIRLNEIILATPRTRILGGALDAGHISYVSRSKLWGFPDITNVWLDGDRLHMRGQLVFGRSDLGVNAARIKGWLDALGQARGQAPLAGIAPDGVVQRHVA